MVSEYDVEQEEIEEEEKELMKECVNEQKKIQDQNAVENNHD